MAVRRCKDSLVTFDNWRDAVKALEGVIRPASEEQLNLARLLDVSSIGPKSPRRLAGAELQRVLLEPLCVRDSVPTPGQLEFLADLASDLGSRPLEPESQLVASAWIEILSAKRAIKALRGLKVHRGDVIGRVNDDEFEPGEVVSIGADGNIYLGAGRRVSAHRAEVLARRSDQSDEANYLRHVALQARLRRESNAGPPVGQRLKALEEHRVSTDNGSSGWRALAAILDDAEDERPLQRYLSKNRPCLASLVRSTYGTFVLSLPRLGAEFVPDFAIASADSLGVHWLLLELESPRAALSTQNGEPSAKLRTALRQVRDWRDWLEDNLDYARRSQAEHGLGLVGIDANADALVLIGTAEERHASFERFRRRSVIENRVSIHTYSWLVSVLRQPRDPLIGPLDLEAADY